MATTLAQVLATPTQAGLLSDTLAQLQQAGLPTSDWGTGSVGRTMVLAFAQALLDSGANAIPGIAAGGFVNLFLQQAANNAQLAAAPNWLDLLAQNLYGLTRQSATFAQGNITLTAAGQAGPYTITAGQLQAADAATGLVFVNTAGGTLTQNNTLTLAFQAQQSGSAYNLPSGRTWTLLTPLPGVTATNPAPTFSSVVFVGTGTGAMTVSANGTPVTGITVTVKIANGGSTGTATYQYQVNGGSWGSIYTTSSGTPKEIWSGGSDSSGTDEHCQILFSTNLSLTYTPGDTFTFSVPGSWLTTQGADQETNAALGARCTGRWATLATGFTKAGVQALATQALVGTSYSSQAVTAYVLTDGTTAGQVDVYLASNGNTASAGLVATVQGYLNQYVPVGESVSVSAAGVTYVSQIAGTVSYHGGNLTQIQQAVQNAIAAYVQSVPMNGTVYNAEVVRTILDQANTVNVVNLSLNANPVGQDIALGATSLAYFTAAVSSGLTWTPV